MSGLESTFSSMWKQTDFDETRHWFKQSLNDLQVNRFVLSHIIPSGTLAESYRIEENKGQAPYEHFLRCENKTAVAIVDKNQKKEKLR